MTRIALAGILAAFAVTAAPSHAQFTVASGYDLFETTFAGFDLDANGPLPPIPFEGVPLDLFDFGPPTGIVNNIAPTDTIVRRINPAIGNGPGSVDTIDIEIVALSLRSSVPFDPDDTGIAPFGFYYTTLQTGVPSLGTMDITFDDADGGTFDSTFTVFLDFHIGAANGPTIFQGSKTFFSTNNSWQRFGGEIPGVNLRLNGFDTSEDFFVPDAFHDDGTGSTHQVKGVPAPGTLSLLAFGGLVAMRRRR